MAFFQPNPRFFFKGGERLKTILKEIISKYSANTEDSNIYAADNMVLISKIAGFLKDKKFVDLANKHFNDDPLHSSIIWRIHILAWAINHAKKIEGDLIEFGCYDAKVAEFLIEYNEIEKTDKKFHLFDIFDNPPTKDVGDKHSPNLYNEVDRNLSKYKCAKVVKGLLPNIYDPKKIEKISFIHFDLNDAKTEIKLLEMVFEKVTAGGIIILDDYGHKGYEEQYKKEKLFFEKNFHSVAELPTGQGLLIKI